MPATRFNNPVAGGTPDGIVRADGFTGALAEGQAAGTPANGASFPNGLVGPLANKPTLVAAAGATQGTATAIAAAALLVFVSTTLSSEGVKLPTPSTGRSITLVATSTTKGFKVYAGAAGQVINAATTATTAYAMTTNHPAEFIGIDATHWRVLRGN